MTNRVGKICPVKRDLVNGQQFEASLRSANLTRMPGTGVFRYVYKEFDGKYRTGLDPDAAYIRRIQDPEAQGLERKRVTDLRDKLQKDLGVDLGPRSEFWDYAKSRGSEDSSHYHPVKLTDGDNLFNLHNPMEEVTFAWLRVHPMIASSLAAYQRGEYPADTQFYVVDDELENMMTYNKKKKINTAIMYLNDMTPDKKKKIARLMELPVGENSKESEVYNLIDNALKETEFKNGRYKSLSPVEIFTRFATLEEALLDVKDTVRQALNNSIYRIKLGGKIYEGETQVAADEDSLVQILMDEDNQGDLIELKEKLKFKKVASV